MVGRWHFLFGWPIFRCYVSFRACIERSRTTWNFGIGASTNRDHNSVKFDGYYSVQSVYIFIILCIITRFNLRQWQCPINIYISTHLNLIIYFCSFEVIFYGFQHRIDHHLSPSTMINPPKTKCWAFLNYFLTTKQANLRIWRCHTWL